MMQVSTSMIILLWRLYLEYIMDVKACYSSNWSISPNCLLLSKPRFKFYQNRSIETYSNNKFIHKL